MRKFTKTTLKHHGWWIVVTIFLLIALKHWSVLLFMAFLWGTIRVGVWIRDKNRIKEEHNA